MQITLPPPPTDNPALPCVSMIQFQLKHLSLLSPCQGLIMTLWVIFYNSSWGSLSLNNSGEKLFQITSIVILKVPKKDFSSFHFIYYYLWALFSFPASDESLQEFRIRRRSGTTGSEGSKSTDRSALSCTSAESVSRSAINLVRKT